MSQSALGECDREEERNRVACVSFSGIWCSTFFVTGDFTMCRVALILSIVLASFCGQIAATQAGTVGYWQFSEKAAGSTADPGDTIIDQGGNGYNGAISRHSLDYVAGPVAGDTVLDHPRQSLRRRVRVYAGHQSGLQRQLHRRSGVPLGRILCGASGRSLGEPATGRCRRRDWLRTNWTGSGWGIETLADDGAGTGLGRSQQPEGYDRGQRRQLASRGHDLRRQRLRNVQSLRRLRSTSSRPG